MTPTVQRRARRRLSRPWRIVAISVCALGVAFLAGACAIVFDGLNDAEGRSDVGVVLGTTVDPEGDPPPGLRPVSTGRPTYGAPVRSRA